MQTSSSAADRPVSRRRATALAALAAASAVVALTPTAGAAVSAPSAPTAVSNNIVASSTAASDDTATATSPGTSTSSVTSDSPAAPEFLAAEAISALSRNAAETVAFVPADFTATFGYRPAMLDGLVVKPSGDCSSPVPLPVEFDSACKAHDLGYDLLRYADGRGTPLGPWARQSLDAALDRNMLAACDTRPGTLARARCTVMADVASVFVDLNSRRQDYGVPVVEPALAQRFGGVGARGAGLAAALTTALGLALVLVRRTRVTGSRPAAGLGWRAGAAAEVTA
ncbi:hypothetical protein [Nocardia farcinica]|uniref:hypothetical protein n=1 Tax=Nocardia farcinica TaxID=37329 RepID=UPI0018949A91|nr:hypothetical protein [Nocardia farcinica]MBF6072360.1 hypothetical protein [Nocardia farcinica]